MKVRSILRPVKEGKNVTFSQAQAAFRYLNRESRDNAQKKTAPREQKSAR